MRRIDLIAFAAALGAPALLGVQAAAEAPQLLFVIRTAGVIDPDDQGHIDLFEEWGYTVQTIEDSASQAEYDAAVADSVVAYVTENMSSAELGTKLRAAPIGVVCEEWAAQDLMGLSQDDGVFFVETQIDVEDVEHYIIEPWAEGHLTILDSSQQLVRTVMTLSDIATVLAWSPTMASTATLSVLYPGDALKGGGAAPARRVFLPWGTSHLGFESLNDDGVELMRRALHWAAEYDATDGPAGGGADGVIITQWRETDPKD